MGNFSHRHHCPDPPDVRHPHELGHEVCGGGVSAHPAQGAFCVRRPWDTKDDNLEFVEESPTKEKICQTRCGTIHYWTSWWMSWLRAKRWRRSSGQTNEKKAAYYTPTENAV